MRSGFPLSFFRPAWDAIGTTAGISAVIGRAAATWRSHVQHPGSDKEARRGIRTQKELQRAFYDPENIRNRPLDLIFVIDRSNGWRSGGVVAGRPTATSTRIGVAGHDFGAQRRWPWPARCCRADRRFPTAGEGRRGDGPPVPLGQVPLDVAYGDLTTPCLHITGTADNSIVATTTASQRRLPFDHTRGADQYLITFFGADHLTYSGHVRKAERREDAVFHRLIAETSTAFWDAYLKDRRRMQKRCSTPTGLSRSELRRRPRGKENRGCRKNRRPRQTERWPGNRRQ